jgi:hypothetical protein
VLAEKIKLLFFDNFLISSLLTEGGWSICYLTALYQLQNLLLGRVMLAVQAPTADWKSGGHFAVLNSPLFSVENQGKPQEVHQVSGRNLRKDIAVTVYD